MITATIFHDCVHNAAAERRRFQRLRLAVQAELRIEGEETPIRVATADISVCGCYLEMPITLAVGTSLAVVLWLGEEKLSTKARVVTCHPQFGNGIEFLGMAADDRSRLDRFLDGDVAEGGPDQAGADGEPMIV